jgi:hypothetical protein
VNQLPEEDKPSMFGLPANIQVSISLNLFSSSLTVGQNKLVSVPGKHIWSGLVWSGLVWSGLVWSGLVWSGLVWSGLVWSGLIWSGLV